MKKYIFLVLLLPVFQLHAMLDVFSEAGLKTLAQGSKSVGLPFLLDSIEGRKRQLDELQKMLETIKVKSQEINQTMTKTLGQIKIDIASSKNQIREFTGIDAEYLSRKVTLLNERRQNILTIQELLKARQAVVEEHIKQVAHYIEILRSNQKEFEEKIAYTLKDLREFEQKITELSERKLSLEGRKENLLRQKNVGQEKISSLKRELEIKEREREKFHFQVTKQVSKDKDRSSSSLKIKADLVDQELNAVKERQEMIALRFEKTTLELEQLDDEFNILKTKLDRFTYGLAQIKKSLVIDAVDVEVAKTEWRKEARKSRIGIEQINKIRDAKQITREKINEEVGIATTKLKKITTAGEEKSPEGYLVDLLVQKLTHALVACDYEIGLLDSKRELFEATLDVKQLETKSIIERYKLSTGHASLDEWLNTIRNKSKNFETALKTSRNKRDEILSSLTQISLTDEVIKKKLEELKSNKDTIFKEKSKNYSDAQNMINEIKASLTLELSYIQQHIGVLSALINRYESLYNQCNLFIKEFESRKLDVDIWSRSAYAISWSNWSRSLDDGDTFLRKIFWATPVFLNPLQGINNAFSWAYSDYLGLLFFILLFILGYLFVYFPLRFLQNKLKELAAAQNGRLAFLYLNLLECLVSFCVEHSCLLYIWLFIFVQRSISFAWYGNIIQSFLHSYYSAIYYLVMIPFALYLANQLVTDLKNLNQRLSFFFFSEQAQSKFIMLISWILYSGAVLLPFRKAFLHYGVINSELPAVLFAAFSLILVIVLLLFFNKEDVIKLLPSQGQFFGWLKRMIEIYYYPVFIFFMGLLILSNPYIGYVRLAWFLVFAVPSSLLLMASGVFVHHYVRKYSLYFFMKENEEDFVIRFEYAKMYYGFFVILSFICVCLLFFMFTARIWGFSYTLPTLWTSISEEWVLKLGDGGKFGLVEMIMSTLFIIISFVVSSLFQKYLLNKLFDIFRTEPGAQNTITRMSHYIVVTVVLILGCAVIGLSAYIKYLLTLLVIGVSLGLKDQITDFFAGLLVLLERQIEIGHYIQTGDIQGTVDKIEARSTTIRTARNFSVIIPNRDLISRTIINWGRGRSSVGFELTLHVMFKTDPELVKTVLFEVIQAHPMVLRMPNVVVRLEDFDHIGQLFFVRAFISSRKLREQWEIASDIRISILKIFHKHDIEIAYPKHLVDIALPSIASSGISIKFDQQV